MFGPIGPVFGPIVTILAIPIALRPTVTIMMGGGMRHPGGSGSGRSHSGTTLPITRITRETGMRTCGGATIGIARMIPGPTPSSAMTDIVTGAGARTGPDACDS